MRVIAGRARGRRLIAPQRLRRRRGSSVRPTSDLVRGAIFSVLASLQADMSRVLDLYAGSGALGIEALSRGGDWCDFIERDRATCETIGENLRLTGFEAQARVYSLPAKRAVEELHGPYTLVLADPRSAAGTGAVTEPVQAVGGEAGQPVAHRLWTAAQRRGDGRHPQPVPGHRDDLRPPDPARRGVPRPGQLANPALLDRVDRRRANNSFGMVDHHHRRQPEDV